MARVSLGNESPFPRARDPGCRPHNQHLLDEVDGRRARTGADWERVSGLLAHSRLGCSAGAVSTARPDQPGPPRECRREVHRVHQSRVDEEGGATPGTRRAGGSRVLRRSQCPSGGCEKPPPQPSCEPRVYPPGLGYHPQPRRVDPPGTSAERLAARPYDPEAAGDRLAGTHQQESRGTKDGVCQSRCVELRLCARDTPLRALPLAQRTLLGDLRTISPNDAKGEGTSGCRPGAEFVSSLS